MKELGHILDEARRLRQTQQAYAVATVVKINGSTYRRPGARMLVMPDGTTRGTISGGCLEQEVAQQALDALDGGEAQVLPFDLSDDDLILGYGIGCDGVVHVLIEPVPMPERTDPLVLVEQCLERREDGVLASITRALEGKSDLLARRLLLFADGTTYGDLDETPFGTILRTEAEQVLADGQPRIRQYQRAEGAVEVLFEVVRPPIRLVVFGTGHDVESVVHQGHTLGWPVTIVGRKPAEELAPRFPQASEHIFLMHPEEVVDYVPLDARTAAVVMNHNYARDKALVGALLQTDVPYVGALGPQRRTERMVSELREEGAGLPGAMLERLHGPVGLDIGTETPQEIALSIAAEVQATLHGRRGGKLRDRAGSIHERVPVA